MKTERLNKRLHIVTTAYERQQIDAASHRLGMSVSQLIRLATQQFINTHFHSEATPKNQKELVSAQLQKL